MSSLTKTRQDNNMINRISVVYAENNIELSWPIGLGVDYDENHINNYVFDCTDAIYAENKTELSWLIGLSVFYDENQIRQRRDWSYKSSLR